MSDLRRSGTQIPVLFLTGRDSVPDRVKGLELGVDDYLVKPFAFSELLGTHPNDPLPGGGPQERILAFRRPRAGSFEPTGARAGGTGIAKVLFG
jgi:CheY-like chemotaxis protein